MAVDTENKRRAAIDFFLFTTDPVPDGTIDTADRQQAAWNYSGITAGAPVVVLAGPGSKKGLLLGVYGP